MLLRPWLLTLFLDADGLVRTAERQHLGWSRTTTLWVMHPIQDVSQTFGLTLPRHWLAEATGHQDSTHITSTAGVKIAEAAATRAGATHHHHHAAELPRPPAAEPLRVLVAGDSLSGQLGPAMATCSGASPRRCSLDEHVGTGLARPTWSTGRAS